MCCGWTGPWGSYCDCKVHLSNNHQETLGKKKPRFISQGSWRPHSKVVGERGECGPGSSARIMVQGERGCGFAGSLYWRIQNLREGIRAQEGTSGVPQAVSYLGCPGVSERGPPWVGQPGSLSSC